MKRIIVKASKSYDILIKKGILKEAEQIISENTNAKQFAIITDDIVDSLYAETVMNSLKEQGFKICKFVFANGEASKCSNVLNKIYDFLCENNITRTDCLIALGGGVVGDITGYAAATYLRGLDYMQIPTTLLAQIDSSVGGKTAINLTCGKNLVGAFKQPCCVIIDPLTLKTLTSEILSDGMAEAIKYGMIRDEELFKLIEQHNIENIMECIEQIIECCVSIKRDVVEADEFDKGERMILNFGHTLGHAIEKYTNYELSHGSAVAAGMCMISESAAKAGLSDISISNRLKKCVSAYNLPQTINASRNILADLCLNDKKRESDNMNYIICDKIGHCIIKKDSVENFIKFISY